jgi:hypothetical protein
MIAKSSSLTIAGRPLRVWLGYSTQRRLGCTTLAEFVVLFAGIFVRQGAAVVDLSTETIERLLAASLCEVAADGETLRHAGVTVEDIRGMVDAEMAAGERLGGIMSRFAGALEEAFTLAEILPPRTDDEPVADEAEAGESDPRPTSGSVSLALGQG